MRIIHVALSVANLDAAIAETQDRLGFAPCVIVPNTYALFRSKMVNLSLSQKPEEAGRLRHLGFEDPEAPGFSLDTDGEGFLWERFTAEQQAQEINRFWPGTNYTAGSI